MTKDKNATVLGRHAHTVLTIIDLVIVNAAFLLVLIQASLTVNHPQTRFAFLLVNMAYIPAAMILNSRSSRRVILMDQVLARSIYAVMIHALFFLALSAFVHIIYSVAFYFKFYGILACAFPLSWIIGRSWVKSLRRRGRNLTNVVIVGTNPTSERLAHELTTDTGFGYNLLGHIDDECVEGFSGKHIGSIDDLERMLISGEKVDEIYFTLVGEKARLMPRVVKIADDHVISFYYVPKISRYVRGAFQLHRIGSMPVLSLRRNPLANPLKRGLKRTFDIIFSGVALVFLAPLVFLPIGIAIKASSPGPVFFRQQRTGYRGRSFTCYKFRTMRVNNDADRAQATADDPRKTRLGDLLRRTSIDELPQFINVFKGDMSVVGPRPHMLKHTEDYTRLIDQYMVRHVVKPGITGWAQINGYRGLTDELWKMERRVECDVWYIENWHFTLDVKIIFRTVYNAIHGEKNAF